ncbi:MAG TPA: hypothetical protein VKA49_14825 [Flavitalea sp.]|nr:hypothetical protein [Flavitalea sp.]
MAGGGDNNKQRSAGLGSSDQSNQPFVPDGEKQLRSNHSRHTGEESALEQTKSIKTDSDRNAGIIKEKIAPLRTNHRKFNLVVDDVPYLVKASPFSFNGERRFYVSVNDSPEHVFTWDSELKRLRAIDDNAGVLPEPVETAISDKLQSKQK